MPPPSHVLPQGPGQSVPALFPPCRLRTQMTTFLRDTVHMSYRCTWRAVEAFLRTLWSANSLFNGMFSGSLASLDWPRVNKQQVFCKRGHCKAPRAAFISVEATFCGHPQSHTGQALSHEPCTCRRSRPAEESVA